MIGFCIYTWTWQVVENGVDLSSELDEGVGDSAFQLDSCISHGVRGRGL